MRTNTERMPRYKRLKEVHALKIQRVATTVDGANEGLLYIVDDGWDYVVVSKEYMERHEPVAGGYYVVYGDGYESFSPARPFEEGYVLITQTPSPATPAKGE